MTYTNFKNLFTFTLKFTTHLLQICVYDDLRSIWIPTLSRLRFMFNNRATCCTSSTILIGIEWMELPRGEGIWMKNEEAQNSLEMKMKTHKSWRPVNDATRDLGLGVGHFFVPKRKAAAAVAARRIDDAAFDLCRRAPRRLCMLLCFSGRPRGRMEGDECVVGDGRE